MRWITTIVVLLALASPALAQHTSVTAVVQDANGDVYPNCTGSASFTGQSPSGGPYLVSGSTFQTVIALNCDGSGNLSTQLWDNINAISPAPSQWRFSLCSASGYTGGPYCGSGLVTITGTSQNVTSALSAFMPILPTTGGSINLASPPKIGNVTPNQGTFTTLNASPIEGIFYADQQAGGSVAAKINAAAALCPAYTNSTGNGCVVVASPGMACGEGNQFADNVLFLDYRNCAQSQGMRFNLSTATSTNVRSKVFIQDNFTVPTIIPQNKNDATFYVISFPDNPDQITGGGGGTNLEAINGTQLVDSLTGNFGGTVQAIEADAEILQSFGGSYTVSKIYGMSAGVAMAGNAGVSTKAISVYATEGVNTTTGTIAEWNGLYVGHFVPNSGNVTKSCEIALANTSGSPNSSEVCINPISGALGSATFTLPAGASQPVMAATLSTTASTTDNVSITGVTASSKCSLTPTNSGAAGDAANTFVSAKTTNQITVTHTSASGHTYDILCSAQ